MKHSQSKSAKRAESAGQVRIIAGTMRGRKVSVPDVQGLRPTGDRVRETLFNWLQGDVAGAHCLDLFAGSGALGFEALSRHASSVTFVEPDPIACRNLHVSCRLLDINITDSPARCTDSAAYLYVGTAQAAVKYWTQLETRPLFDLVFIDPPFDMGCQWTILQSLGRDLLARQALIYVEAPVSQAMPAELPEEFDIVRDKRFGDVEARLVRYSRTT